MDLNTIGAQFYFYAKALAIGVGVVLVWTGTVYNGLIKKRNQVKTDLSDITIQVARKVELVDRLIDLVKEYSNHEKNTFENVTRARSALNNSHTARDTAKANNMLTDTLRSVMLVVENYPKLQASENFRELRIDLKEIENSIAAYREEYNLSVQNYNNSVETFPNLLVAWVLGFKSEQLFDIETISH